MYVAGLYLEAKSSDADAILRAELPKRIVFVFVRSIGRKRIIREWDESLKANVGEDFAALEDRVATLHAWMPDAVGKGEEMRLTYLPGRGVVVEIKGEARGTIPGADFARALFAIWLGAKPPNKTLKMGLLGRGRQGIQPGFPERDDSEGQEARRDQNVRGGGGTRVARTLAAAARDQPADAIFRNSVASQVVEFPGTRPRQRQDHAA